MTPSSSPQAGSPWFSAYGPDQGRFRLFCFPHAGSGGMIFRRWNTFLPADGQVQAAELPGRLRRYREAPLLTVAAMVRPLADAIAERSDAPFAFYGHSFGALVAFEVARELRRRGGPSPFLFACGAAEPPHLLAGRDHVHHLADEDFLRICTERYGGFDPRLLEHESTRAMFLRPTRADMTALETYDYAEEPPFDFPLTILGGRDDHSTHAPNMRAWSEHTTGPFALHMVQAGHFFPPDAPAAFASPVGSAIRAGLAANRSVAAFGSSRNL